MKAYPELVQKLIAALKKLPGIGPRSAERIVFHILKEGRSEARELGEILIKIGESIQFCKRCHSISEKETCAICEDATRDKKFLCVVETPKDLIALEKAGGYNGLYHVLLGVLSPLEGIGPRELGINDLVKRVKQEKPAEVILATNTNIEGETTALYLTKVLKPLGVKITRPARGLPVGGDIEYADEATLARAMEGRTAV